MPSEHRHSDRYPIEVWGKYRLANGVRREVVLKDLSDSGCRFYDKFSGLRGGERISIRIETLGPYDASVVWSEGGYVGVEFAQRLYGPMFDHIRLKLSGGH
ncbi:PilZ domain-containing protein [Tsuneonella mangrovi]|uniref:PilZ domain-containing protein n=1 Tax=Tsuneonella mangrovi TaxID=1982042 RepID=UPI000BA1F9BE|nr:PilZ domain-containing protein [Tsuneonella mangrovi]